MVIAATIWSAIAFMFVAFFQRFFLSFSFHDSSRRKIFGTKSQQIVLDADSSTHSDLSENSTAHPVSRMSQDLVIYLFLCAVSLISSRDLVNLQGFMGVTRQLLILLQYRQRISPNHHDLLSRFHLICYHHHHSHSLMRKTITSPADFRYASWLTPLH
jgi:hypothetical protein